MVLQTPQKTKVFSHRPDHLLLIHGDSDRFISPSSMEILYARAPRERTERLLISDRGHSDIVRDFRCGQEIVAFFCKNLRVVELVEGAQAKE